MDIEFEDGKAYVIDPDETFIRMACCDCGLVHDITIVILPDCKQIAFTLRRNEDETEKLRGDDG